MPWGYCGRQECQRLQGYRVGILMGETKNKEANECYICVYTCILLGMMCALKKSKVAILHRGKVTKKVTKSYLK